MLALSEIQSFFPEELHRFPRFMIREYLQVKILEILYEGLFPSGLCFLGGTCLRIVHNNTRFSEDLDFDNLSMNEKEFEEIAGHIIKMLGREGYQAEMKMVMKDAWHCHIKFPGLLYGEGLSGYMEEIILIQLDTEPQHFDYEPERFILNRFDVFTTLLTTPLPLLMAQKLYAVINRERNKGRDFYDLVFLMSKQVQPDYKYLDQKLSITDPKTLRQVVLDKCESLNLNDMAKDVEPFLFGPTDVKRVRQFTEYRSQRRPGCRKLHKKCRIINGIPMFPCHSDVIPV